MIEGAVFTVLGGSVSASVVGISELTASVDVGAVAGWKLQVIRNKITSSRKEIVMHVKVYGRCFI